MSRLVDLIISFIICAIVTANAYKVVSKSTTNLGTLWVYNTHDGKRCYSYTSPSVGQDLACKRFKNFSHIEQEYVKHNMASLLMFKNPSEDIKKIFIAGLGTGSLVEGIQTLCPNAQIDVYEINPDVVKMASKHFDFKAAQNSRVQVGDAYDFIKAPNATDYDLIILDAFMPSFSGPQWLELKQFYKIAKLSLKKDTGIFVVNAVENAANPQYPKVVFNMRKAFGHFYIVNGYTNRVIISSENGALPGLNEIVESASTLNFKQIGVDSDNLIRSMAA